MQSDGDFVDVILLYILSHPRKMGMDICSWRDGLSMHVRVFSTRVIPV